MNTIIKALRDPSVRLIIIKGLRRTGKSSILRVALNLAKYNYILLDMREFAEIDRETFTRAFSKALLDMLREKSKRR
ncbi:MAG: ATP-binding protein, partial [Candidatus Njordarchaeales archaeon]